MALPERKMVEAEALKYDTILIGSGVVNILEAAYQLKQGKSVLIIEATDALAGAWSTVKHPNIPEVEIGCHIWDRAEGTHEFLAELLHLNVQPLNPKPRIHTKGLRIPYDWKTNAITLKRMLRLLSKLNFAQMRADMKQPYHRLNLWPSNYYYPVQGAFELKNGIKAFVDSRNIPIQYNEKIRSIEMSKKAKVTTQSGKEYHAEEIVITSLCDIEEVKIKEEVFENSPQRVDYIHVHLVLKNAFNKGFSYDRIMGNPLIHRISDMTSQVQGELENGEILICVGVFQDAFHSMDENKVAENIVHELTRLKYVKASTEIVTSGINLFPARYANKDLLDEVHKQSEGKLQVLRSTNFTYSIHTHLERWKSLLE